MGSELFKELQSLRRGRGLTLTKLEARPLILETLGVVDAHQALDRLVGAVKKLGEDIPALALRNAYAIDVSAPGKLTQRRFDFAELHERHADTIETYENTMIEELCAWLEPRAGEVEVTVVLFDGRIDRATARVFQDGQHQVHVLETISDHQTHQLSLPLQSKGQSVHISLVCDDPDPELSQFTYWPGNRLGPQASSTEGWFEKRLQLVRTDGRFEATTMPPDYELEEPQILLLKSS